MFSNINLIKSQLKTKEFLERKLEILRAEEQEIIHTIYKHPNWKEDALYPYETKLKILKIKIDNIMAQLINIEANIRKLNKYQHYNYILHPAFGGQTDV